MKTALITGICGQDGAYLTKSLQNKGYKVHGIAKRNSDRWRLEELGVNPIIHEGDLTESPFVTNVIYNIKPDEIYNLAAQSHVGYSFENPHLTMDVNYGGLVNILEGIKVTGTRRVSRVYQASTSELFGWNDGKELNEDSPIKPKSPYAVAKLAAYSAIINARKEGFFACNGILFNHESPLRGHDFVTRKITIGMAKLKADESYVLELGNIDAKRDWGHAKDYVEAMHSILNYRDAGDYVVGTGKAYSVRDFLDRAFRAADIEITSKAHEGTISEQWMSHGRLVMKINSKFYRPNDVDVLIADPEKAFIDLDWQAETEFHELVTEMVEADLRRYK